MDISKFVEEMTIKMKAFEEEHRRLSEENADLRKQLAAHKPQTDDVSLITIIQQKLDTLKKQLETDARFHNLVDRHTGGSEDVIRSNRNFIIERMLEGNANFEVQPYSVLVATKSVEFRLEFDIFCEYGFLYVNKIFAADKLLWSDSDSTHFISVDRWSDLIEACSSWPEQLRRSPDGKDTFHGYLELQNLL